MAKGRLKAAKPVPKPVVVPEREECAICRFIDAGQCRRYPPTVFHDSRRNKATTMWPLVSPDNWCGEFRRAT
jgi:hypothetical protein